MRFLIAFTIVLSFVSCNKDTSWDSAWQVPLLRDSLHLHQWVNDSLIAPDGNGFYHVEINRDVFSLNLADYLDIPDTSVVQKYAIGINSINVPPGTSFVNNNKDHVFDLKGAQLKKIRVSSGKIDIEIANPIQTATIFTVTLPGVSKNGVNITRTFQVPAGTLANPTRATASLSLDGYDINLTGTNGSGFNLLRSEMLVKTDPAGPAVTVTKLDSTEVKVRMSSLKLDYARGYFGQLTVNDSSNIDLSFLKKIVGGTAAFQDASLQLYIKNGIKVGALINIQQLANVHPNNGTVNLQHPQFGVPFMINPAQGTWNAFTPFVSQWNFTPLNSNLAAFLSNLGPQLKLNYNFQLNPFGNVSAGWDEFFPNSRLQLYVKAAIPMGAQFNQLTLRDTFALNIQQNTERTHIKNGELRMNINNAFPISAQLKLRLLDENKQVLSVIPVQNAIASSLGGMPQNGLFVASSQLKIALTKDQTLALNDAKHLVLEAVFDTPSANNTGNQQMNIPEKAYLSFTLQAKVNVEARY